MIVEFRASFQRDLKKFKNKQLLDQVREIIVKVEEIESLLEMPNIKKLGKSGGYYRIRTGDYRIGIREQNRIVTFIRFLHRKDIYKYFP